MEELALLLCVNYNQRFASAGRDEGVAKKVILGRGAALVSSSYNVRHVVVLLFPIQPVPALLVLRNRI